MAYEIDTLDISLLAATDLSSYQYCFVKITAANTVNVCGAGEACVGILQNKPSAAGQAARVRVFGVSRILADGVGIGFGDKVGSGASGVGTVMVSNKDIFAGIALDSSAASTYGSVLLTGQQTLSA
jgi:hypothetical protein